MPRSKITIEKINDHFLIKKDKNYQSFFSMSVIFYHRVIEVIKQDSGMNVAMNPKFEILLTKLSFDNEKIIIDLDQLKLMVDWVDCLCLIMLEIENLDFKNKEIKKYLRLSESFIFIANKFLKTEDNEQ